MSIALAASASPVWSQISIGVACASYWRGAWYVLDDNLFPHNPLYSATASLGLGSAGLVLAQGFIANQCEKEQRTQMLLANKKNHHPGNHKLQLQLPSLKRFGTLYCVATSCVLVWRGTWMFWDIAYETFGIPNENAHGDPQQQAAATDRGHLTKSGILSHSIAIGCLLAFGRFSSVLAPPARASILSDFTFKAKTWKEYSSAAKSIFK